MRAPSLFEQAKTGLYVPHSAPEGIEVASITIQSFGTNGERRGPVNAKLAQFALDYADEHDLKGQIIAQVQVANEINDLGAGDYLKTVIDSDNFETQGDLDTFGVLQRAMNFIEPGTATSLVAQAQHAPRVGAMANKLGVASELPEELPNDFDPKSDQWWVRDEDSWALKERLVLLHHKLKGRI